MCLFGFRLPQFKEELKSGVITNIRKVGLKLLQLLWLIIQVTVHVFYCIYLLIDNSLEDDHKMVEKTLHLIFLLWSLLFLTFFSQLSHLAQIFCMSQVGFLSVNDSMRSLLSTVIYIRKLLQWINHSG